MKEEDLTTEKIADMTGIPDDFPDICKEHKAWCIRIIHQVLAEKLIREQMQVTTPTVPPAKQEEVRKKCHEVAACVEKQIEKLKNALLEVGFVLFIRGCVLIF